MADTYAIGDIHGMADILRPAIKIIMSRTVTRGPCTLVALGDYLDRGPDSKKVLDMLDALTRFEPKIKVVTLMGNHEDMLLQEWDGHLYGSAHVPEDDDEVAPTYKSFGMKFPFHVKQFPAGYIERIRTMPLYYEDQHRVYVHAWLDETLSLEEQKRSNILWNRYGQHKLSAFSPTTQDVDYRGKYVVHGHTPLDKPFIGKGRCNLDTGAFFSGTLTMARFDDDTPGGPVEVLPIR